MASLPALNRQRQALPLAGRLEACSSTVAQWSRSTCNIQNMELRQSLQGHEGCVNALCWSPDGQYLFSGSDDSTICIWRAASDGSRICKIKTGFAERVFDLKVMPAPNDHLLIACSMDHSIKIFDIHRILLAASGTEGSAVIGPADFCIRTFTAHSSPVKRAAPIPDSPNQFLSCSEDGTARHYDIREPPRRSPGHPDGSRIVADYHMIHAELHALDVNPFYTHSFAVGGTMLSIMVHDLRMPRVSSMPQRRCDSCGQDVASSGCVVRLRRGRAKDRREVFEKATQNPVTGLRFSRDVPNQIIGSWCYDYVYLFDLNQSQTYMHSLAAREAPSPSKVSGDGGLASSSRPVLSKVKRVRSGNSDTLGVASLKQEGGSKWPGSETDSSTTSSLDHSKVDRRRQDSAFANSEWSPMAASRNMAIADTTSEDIASSVRQSTQSFGIRVMSENEAPYLFESHSDTDAYPASTAESSDNSASSSYKQSRPWMMHSEHHEYTPSCDKCVKNSGREEHAKHSLRAALGGSQRGMRWALSPDEKDQVSRYMYQFADLLDDGEYKEAIGIMSLFIRGFEGGSFTYSGDLPTLLESADNMKSEQKIVDTWKDLYMDDDMDRRRVFAIGHINRAAMNMFVYRCRWLHRFQVYLLRDLRQLSIGQLQTIRQDFELIRSDLEWARRDCEMALQLNPFSILAHSHMLSIEWEMYRSDVLMFILELIPTVDDFFRTESSPPYWDDDNVPVRSRLRAEFGNMPQRLHELCQRTSRSFKRMRAECEQIGGLAFHLGIADGKPNTSFDSIWCRLRYVNRRFYGMPSATVLAVHQDSTNLEARLDNAGWMLDECVVEDIDSAEGMVVLAHLAKYWVSLNAESISTSNTLVDDPSSLASMFLCNAQDDLGYHPFDPGMYYLDKFVEGNFDCQTLPAIGPKKLDENLQYAGSFSDDGEEVGHVYSSSGLLVKDLHAPSAHAAHKAPRPPPFSISMRVESGRDRSDSSSSACSVSHGDTYATTGSGSEASSSDMSSSDMSSTSIDSSEDEDSSDMEFTDQSESASSLFSDTDWPRPTVEFVPGRDMATNDREASFLAGSRTNTQPELDSTAEPTPIVQPHMCYKGHCNFQTIKDVNFVFDKYIASGSDDGRMFIWDRQSMEIVQIIRGDNEVVNIIESHPTLPLIAVSGIDCEVHIFSINQGGPSPIHRQTFPLVRREHLALVSITNGTSKYIDDIYACDPYAQDLAYSGHSLWPSDAIYDAVAKQVSYTFPVVSESELANKTQIVFANQELRQNGITNASLTHRLMSNIFFNAMLGSRRIANDDTSEQSDDDMDEDYDSDMDGFSDGFIREAQASTFFGSTF